MGTLVWQDSEHKHAHVTLYNDVENANYTYDFDLTNTQDEDTVNVDIYKDGTLYGYTHGVLHNGGVVANVRKLAELAGIMDITETSDSITVNVSLNMNLVQIGPNTLQKVKEINGIVYADLFEMAQAYGAQVDPVDSTSFHITRYDYETNQLVGGKLYTESQCILELGAAYFPVHQLATDLGYESNIFNTILDNGTKVIFVGSNQSQETDIVANFLAGVLDGAIENIVGLWQLITHLEILPEILLEALVLLDEINNASAAEKVWMCVDIFGAVIGAIDDFVAADDHIKARMVGNVLGAILIEILLAKGAAFAVNALKVSAKTGTLASWVGKVGRGEATTSMAGNAIKTVAEAIAKIKYGLRNISYTDEVIKTADEMNEFWRLKGYTNPPYKADIPVSQIKLTEKTNFIKVYDGVTSSEQGQFVMKLEDITNADGSFLTAQQIKDKYALEFLPRYVADAEIPTGAILNSGIAGPIDGCGAGGGLQFDLNGAYTGNFTFRCSLSN